MKISKYSVKYLNSEQTLNVVDVYASSLDDAVSVLKWKLRISGVSVVSINEKK